MAGREEEAGIESGEAWDAHSDAGRRASHF